MDLVWSWVWGLSRFEVNIRIRKTIKSLESPLPVLMVLQLNIAEAGTTWGGKIVCSVARGGSGWRAWGVPLVFHRKFGDGARGRDRCDDGTSTWKDVSDAATTRR